MTNESNIVDMDQARRRLVSKQLQVVTVDLLSSTGAKPFRALVSNQNIYWCKWPENPHGASEVVNELVASIVGAALGAPVRDWEIIWVPDDLDGDVLTNSDGDRVRLRSGPVFGSLLVSTAIESDQINYVSRDQNYDRVPLLIALWLLCNAEDIQMLYELGADHSIWSIDHGFWFGSFEREWELGEPEEFAGRPELPRVAEGIPAVHWDRAIDAVRRLEIDLFAQVIDVLPQQWNIETNDVKQLCEYVYRRREYAIQELEFYRNSRSR